VSNIRFIFVILAIEAMNTKQKDQQRTGKGEKTPMTPEELERFLDHYLRKIELEKANPKKR
jgi:hypothetical protein